VKTESVTAFRFVPFFSSTGGAEANALSSFATAIFQASSSFPARCISESDEIEKETNGLIDLVYHVDLWRCKVFKRIRVVLLAERSSL
jgi:hypothetical protein